MVRKIKFPLEMADGVMVRTLEELKENFDLENIIINYKSGKLLTWLNDRYYESEAEQVEKLNVEDINLAEALCSIFDIKYCEELAIDIESIEDRNLRLLKLKQFTNDDEVIRNVDKVAFNQEELAELLDNEEKKIYLCGEVFNIPLRIEGITYIGVNNPIVGINSKVLVDFKSRDIELKNIRFNEEYTAILEAVNSEKNNKASYPKYATSKLLDFMMKDNDRQSSKKLFEVIIRELGEVSYDNEKRTKRKVEIIKSEKLNDIFESYLSRIY